MVEPTDRDGPVSGSDSAGTSGSAMDDDSVVGSSNENAETQPNLRRRTLLGIGTAAVTSGLLTGLASAGVERKGIQFDRVVDAVDDLGLDPRGGGAISGTLSDVPSGTLVEFPDGTYQLGATDIEVNDRVGFVGTGDVTWRFDSGYRGRFLRASVDEFLFEGIDIDQTSKKEVSGHMRLLIGDRCVVENVTYLGRGYSAGYAFKPHAVESDAVVVLRNVSVPYGANPSVYGGNNDLFGRIGVFAGERHHGLLRILDCEFSDFGNNGIYASRTNGDVQVEDSYFLNNGVTGIRISGGGSWVKRCVVEVDTSKYEGPALDDGWGTWGIKAENEMGHRTEAEYPIREAGCLVEDCKVLLKDINDGGKVGAGIKVGLAERSLTVRNTEIHVDIDDGLGRSTHAVLRSNPYGDWDSYRKDVEVAPKPHSIVLDNVTVTGSAAGDAAVRIVNSEDSVVRNSCIQQTGSNRAGIRVFGSDGTVLEDSNVNVTGDAIDIVGGDVATSGLSYDESCSRDGSTGDGSDDTGDTEPSNVLTIEGLGDTADYAFTVDEALEKNPDQGSINDGDVVDGLTATGVVGSGDDSYRFDATVTDFSLSGDANVYVNGTEVDPANLGSGSTDDGSDDTTDTSEPSRVLTIKGTGERAEYAFAVDEALEKNPDVGTINDGDVVDGLTATGVVGSGDDSYRFGATVTDFSLSGDARVFVDGTKVDPSSLG